ncbi:hypothetical protein FHS31_001671 [Sphingomonas vulcanisoli]|uniref:PEP-CTERM sorting domain-containing protein n=1 Tax=Sphingomonas vulcanisoli TaxID=1658060 RepID=A0ABX0TRI5_9SPHN|nr:hypothetical protein [Sphingomonas vulcanisoli]NIJ08061.1 hypothetical protein [Sphingomonas vulcanisoli]
MAEPINLGNIYDTGVTSQMGWTSNDTLSATYNFTLTAPTSTLSYTLHDVTVQGLSMKFYDSNNTLVKNVRVANSGQDRGADLDLTGGLYKITLVGTSISNFGQPGGGYQLSLRSNVAAPVPGPAGALVAVAGAGVVAFRKRRARKLADA